MVDKKKNKKKIEFSKIIREIGEKNTLFPILLRHLQTDGSVPNGTICHAMLIRLINH